MKNIVHLCDCMDFMKSLPDKAYSLAIVDPPYGIGICGQKESVKGKKSDRKKHEIKGWDVRPNADYFDELFRVSENQIIWGGNYFIKFLFPTKGWMFWYKGQNGLTMSDGELAWSSFNVPTRQFELNRMALTIEGTIHPTQKPIALYRWLLNNYAKPGDTIFDSHVGSGSIRIACDELGFDFEGCELDPDYYEAQEKRYSEYKMQPRLFEPVELKPRLLFDGETA